MPKRGAISDKEKQFLKDNHTLLSPAEIAKALDRNEETVRQWFVSILKLSPDDEEVSEEEIASVAIEKEFLKSPEWESLKEEFSEHELKYFRHRYKKLMAQLQVQGEVTPTEETQIFLMIKYEILMKRNLADAKDSVEEVQDLTKMLQKLKEDYPEVAAMDDSTKNFFSNLENQLLAAKSARQQKSSEYVKLTEKHTSLMRELKATRDQRISRIDAAGGSLLDIFKALQHEDAQARTGRTMNLMSMAMDKEKNRLSELHKYADGGLDQPLLTPENVIVAEGNMEDNDG